MKSLLKRSSLFIATVVGTLAVAPALSAQSPAPGSAKLVGEWAGNYTTDGPSGTMTITVSKTGEAWKLANTLGGDTPPPGDVRDFVADGDKISWRQSFGEYEVNFKASLSADGTQITGTIEATQGGTAAGSGTFTLTKK